jgi:hypothetical protein
MKILFLFILLLLSTPASWSRDQNTKDNSQCLCAKIYMPVCAGNKNFGNSCEALCAGFKTFEEGQCPKPTNKPKITPTYEKNKSR